jgi:hypothetical protein
VLPPVHFFKKKTKDKSPFQRALLYSDLQKPLDNEAMAGQHRPSFSTGEIHSPEIVSIDVSQQAGSLVKRRNNLFFFNIHQTRQHILKRLNATYMLWHGIITQEVLEELQA